MSVINKMLRDLDDGAAAARGAVPSLDGVASVTRDTVTVSRGSPDTVPPGLRAWHKAMAALGVAAVLWAVGWWWPGAAVTPDARLISAAAQPPTMASAAAVSVFIDADASVPSQRVAAADPLTQPGDSKAEPGPASARARPLPPQPALARTVTSVPKDALADSSRLQPPAAMTQPASTGSGAASRLAGGDGAGLQSMVTLQPAALPYATASPVPALATPLSVQPRPTALWNAMATETLARAQGLWRTGEREHAARMLQAALPDPTQNSVVGSGPGEQIALTLLRELVRMELELEHHMTVASLLRTQELLVAQQADLWAIRAQAEQRIGQHARAVQSYRTALVQRPGQARWMFALAVSLAATGQTSAAAEQLSLGSAIAPVPPAVFAYLRDLGVLAP